MNIMTVMQRRNKQLEWQQQDLCTIEEQVKEALHPGKCSTPVFRNYQWNIATALILNFKRFSESEQTQDEKRTSADLFLFLNII